MRSSTRRVSTTDSEHLIYDLSESKREVQIDSRDTISRIVGCCPRSSIRLRSVQIGTPTFHCIHVAPIGRVKYDDSRANRDQHRGSVRRETNVKDPAQKATNINTCSSFIVESYWLSPLFSVNCSFSLQSLIVLILLLVSCHELCPIGESAQIYLDERYNLLHEIYIESLNLFCSRIVSGQSRVVTPQQTPISTSKSNPFAFHC